MKPDIILQLLGHSAHNPELDKVFQFFNINDKPDAIIESWGDLSISGVENNTTCIYFNFTTEFGYNNWYGKVKSRFTEEKYELFLNEVTFGDETPYSYELPFGLKIDDDFNKICSKIQYLSKHKSDIKNIGIVYRFLTNDYEIIIKVNNKNEISFVRVLPIKLIDLKILNIKKTLKSQNKNINDKYVEEIKNLKNQLPSINWANEKRDEYFNEKNISESESLFNKFLDQLIQASLKKDATKIYTSIKNITVGFNKLQKKYDGFIETLEREDIIDFCNKAIKFTGFKIDNETDLTEDLREW